MQKKDKVISLMLFALAGMLFAYTIWAFVNCYQYIADAIAAGQLATKGNEYDIMNFYMSSCAQYLVFAVLVFAMGWLIHRRPSTVSKKQSSRAGYGDRVAQDKDEEDLDEWFEEILNEDA
jgi:uncharacterized membrane protein YdbT with pleckstrin-like domain